jgi:hypothetical protein
VEKVGVILGVLPGLSDVVDLCSPQKLKPDIGERKQLHSGTSSQARNVMSFCCKEEARSPASNKECRIPRWRLGKAGKASLTAMERMHGVQSLDDISN